MALNNEKDFEQLKKRFRDLSDRADTQGIFCFTGFLGLAELDAFWQMESSVRESGYTIWGGAQNSERCMIRFGKVEELGYEIPFPIKCIHVEPIMAKFADKLTHRDFLGALMNLGIERSTIGDIIAGEKECYIFCNDSIAAFICENLDQVKHTNVRAKVVEECTDLIQEEPKLVTIMVASARVDACIAKIYNKSRSECLELFRTGKVYVNGRCCENNSKLLAEGDVVNARGYGKFKIVGEIRTTKKGKLCFDAEVYR